MPSYRYLRDIKPEDLKPETPPEYSKKEKAENWWHYHWGWVAGGAALLALVAYFVFGIVTRVNPDYTIGFVVPFSIPEELTTQLADGLTPLLPDKNGDGKTVVSVEVFTLAAIVEETGSAPQSQTAAGADPYTQMAGVTRLSGALSAADDFIFLISPEEAQAYQDTYRLFGNADGTLAEEGADIYALSVAFKDCPALAKLDLKYTNFNYETIDGQKLFANYRVGLRPIYGTSAENEKGGLENWQASKELYDLLTAAP